MVEFTADWNPFAGGGYFRGYAPRPVAPQPYPGVPTPTPVPTPVDPATPPGLIDTNQDRIARDNARETVDYQQAVHDRMTFQNQLDRNPGDPWGLGDLARPGAGGSGSLVAGGPTGINEANLIDVANSWRNGNSVMENTIDRTTQEYQDAVASGEIQPFDPNNPDTWYGARQVTADPEPFVTGPGGSQVANPESGRYQEVASVAERGGRLDQVVNAGKASGLTPEQSAIIYQQNQPESRSGERRDDAGRAGLNEAFSVADLTDYEIKTTDALAKAAELGYNTRDRGAAQKYLETVKKNQVADKLLSDVDLNTVSRDQARDLYYQITGSTVDRKEAVSKIKNIWSDVERAKMNKEDGGMVHYRQGGGLIDLSGAPQMQPMAPNTPLPPSGGPEMQLGMPPEPKMMPQEPVMDPMMNQPPAPMSFMDKVLEARTKIKEARTSVPDKIDLAPTTSPMMDAQGQGPVMIHPEAGSVAPNMVGPDAGMDVVDTELEPGSMVMNAEASDLYGEELQTMLNGGEVQMMFNGGIVNG